MLTTAGELIGLRAARAAPLDVAAANWVATALLVARALPDAILLDCGGTTTDLIPIAGGEVAAQGRTDLERLLAGELVYTGALRTNVAAIVRTCRSTAAVPGVVGAVRDQRRCAPAARQPGPEQCTCSFPDGRGASLGRGPRPAGAGGVRRPRAARRGRSRGDRGSRRGGTVDVDRSGLARVAARAGAGDPVVAVGVGAFLAREAARAAGCRSIPTFPLAARAAAAGRPRPRWRCRYSAVSEPPAGRQDRRRPAAEHGSRACARLRRGGRAGRRRPVLVVPGGGPFADAVRAVDERVGLSDDVAHGLALRAMDQLGLLLRRCCPAPRLRELAAPRGPACWRRRRRSRAAPGVPESWAVTSDSLAVLAAGAIGARARRSCSSRSPGCSSGGPRPSRRCPS